MTKHGAAATAFLIAVVATAGAAAPVEAAGPHDDLLAKHGARLATAASDPGAAGALAVVAGLEEDVDPRALEAAVRGGTGARAHPLVAAQAAWLLARLYEQRGGTREAEAQRAPLGLLSHVAVIGPFGQGRASFATSFPPEEERALPDIGRSYPGKTRDVAWRSGDAAVRDGVLYLDGLIRPGQNAVAYVAAAVHSDRDRAAAFRIGSPGPVKVWINGAPVLHRDVVRPAALDQDAVGVRLGRGWNRILIKTVITDGGWRLYARFTEPSGAPLRLDDKLPSPPPKDWARANAAKVPGVASLAQLLERRAAGKRPPATASLDLARFLAWNTPRDNDERAAFSAFERALHAAPTVEARLGAADAATDDDEARRVLETALAQEPPPPWKALVLARLGGIARGARRDARALEMWRGALATDPGCWLASLALAQEEADSGLPLAGTARLAALPPDVQARPRIRRAAIRLYIAAGREAEADRLLVALAGERRRDVELLHQLSARARRRGDAQEARARLAAAAALRPDVPSLQIELARLFEGDGDRVAALATLTAAVDTMPDEPSTLVAQGKLLHRMGRAGDGLERLRTALVLRPQDPELKRYVDRLAAGDRDDSGAVDELGPRFAEDARALLPPAGKPASDASGSGAVVLLDRRVVRVHRNGLSRTFAQRVVHVLTERGAEENKEFGVHYTPGREEVDIRQARVYRRGARGEIDVLEATDRSDEDLSEPWYGLYYDNRAEIVRFEGLRPGDVLEIQYLVEDVASDNQMADYFGDLQYIAENIPKRRWDYTLIAPASRPIHANVPKLPKLAQLQRQVTEEGSERVYRYTARDIAKIDAEPAMPGPGETTPYLHVSTYASWSDVGAWYWRLAEESLAPDDEIRRTARGLVTRNMSDADRVRAVYDFVVTGTRYVGLEFGIHGFKPYKVTQVLARRFGDCKDKAALLIALLREVGVTSELVLVRTRRGGRLDTEPASLAIFDHAIVYVPKLDRYLDGTAEFAGLAELPAQDQGVMALRVGAHGSVLVETPLLASSESRVERRWQVAIEPTGDGRVDEQLIIKGQAAPNWREHYQTPGERRERYGRVWSGRFPGAKLDTVDMPRIEDRNTPVTVRASVTVPRLARASGAGALELPVTGRDADFVRTYARLSARGQDLVLAYPWQHDEELSYRLPAGWRLAMGVAPPARVVDSPFGSFRLEVAVERGVVRVRSSLNVTRARIVPADYARFRAFLLEVDATLNTPLGVTADEGSGS